MNFTSIELIFQHNISLNHKQQHKCITTKCLPFCVIKRFLEISHQGGTNLVAYILAVWNDTVKLNNFSKQNSAYFVCCGTLSLSISRSVSSTGAIQLTAIVSSHSALYSDIARSLPGGGDSPALFIRISR